MKITIGDNIKRLRKTRNITQEQLAEVLGISVTAVSKWERCETYPDITLLFPLAHYFGTTLDELMGYDEEKIRAEIDETLAEYRKFWFSDPPKAREIIVKAYRDYPDDYWVMHYYMWNIAGDMADNDPNVLLEHSAEFENICRKLLEGCTDETLRLNAWNMRAKILHAEGKTDKALAIYRHKFTNWYATSGQKSEQLFAKDTPEFRRCLLLNRYELADFALDKMVKEIWFCCDGTLDEKLEKSRTLLDLTENAAEQLGDPSVYLGAFHVTAAIRGMLNRFDGSNEQKSAIDKRRNELAQKCDSAAAENEVIREYIKNRYNTDKLS